MPFKSGLFASLLCAGCILTTQVQASDNPFLPRHDAGLLRLAEGKCGGGSATAPDEDQSKCGSEMKCGEGKCGDAMMSDQDDDQDGNKCGGTQPSPQPSPQPSSKCGGAH